MGDAVLSPAFDPLFGPVAISHGWAPPLRYILRRHRALRILSTLQPGDALEVGCGAGALLDEVARAGWRATGVESSPRALALAKLLAADSGQGQVLLPSLPAPGEVAFDLVLALDVLEHIENDAGALRDWVNLLRPQGRLLISVPAHPARWSAGDEWAGHFRRYTRRGLVALFDEAGLLIEHFECYGFPLANLTEAFGASAYRRMIGDRAGEVSKADATAESGIERAGAARLYRWLSTPVGRAGLHVGLACQALTAKLDWGSGYLVTARRQ